MSYPNAPLWGNPDLLTSTAAVSAAPARVMAVLITGITNDCKVEYSNDADGNGAKLLTVGAAAEQGYAFINLRDLGGVIFDTALYATITGTCVVHTWYEPSLA